MTRHLDLLRHGETECGGGFRGSLDDALTVAGWTQMRAATAEAGSWDLVVSSPLRRCADFAIELAAAQGLPLQVEADLRELHFGAWEGRNAGELMHDDAEGLGRFWADPYAFTPPDGEPVADFEARVLGAVERLRRDCVGRRLLLVTHGGVMRLLLARARGLPREHLLQVTVAHGALHRLRLDGLDWREL
ncbi:alpha-ribazole phosphatase family protein [Azotobacter beijerinckii]|uniref:Alpha-ribazole phosphatase n=1 Tax=Azotobacter beijerinckii TaxID=170623 RepID=A0A1I4DEJ3_9GAMM|nr:alpha-ribazole phosphatase family protein [Azotobacter beijerinckii]SFB35813.1 alpha-ribazole phosphatase [Azotobacter beijerinckii]SFK90506.1 alpha-ribazole phosphatase [Azotobacter beijerinckii]